MKRKLILAAALGAIAVIVFLAFPSNERQIRKLLNRLVDEATVTTEEHPFEQQRRALAITKLFRNPALLIINRPDKDAEIRDYSNAALNEKILALRNRVSTLSISVDTVKIESAGTSAAVVLALHGEGSLVGEKESEWKQARLQLKLVKEEGDWKIAELENLLASKERE